jgi:hypothetical protein
MTPAKRAADFLKQQLASSGLTMRQWYRQIYLKSDHWRDLRQIALEKAGFKCSSCGCGGSLDVHHERYKSIYNVTQDDLSVLCRKCHKAEHEGKKDIRQANRKPRQPKRKKDQQPSQEAAPSQKKGKVQKRKLVKAYNRGKKEAGGTHENRVAGGYTAVCRCAKELGELSHGAAAYVAQIKKNFDNVKRFVKPGGSDPIDKLPSNFKGLF